jgi:amino acid adenylation domain-containing protein
MQFLRHARESPDAVAIELDGVTTSYAELLRRSVAIAEALNQSGTPVGACVAVFGTQSTTTYASIIGTWLSGRAYCPLNPNAPEARNRSCLLQSGATILLAAGESAAASTCVETDAKVIDVRNARHSSRLSYDEAVRMAAGVQTDQLAYLLFTSGSTGAPKGVPIYHRNLNSFLRAILHGTDWKLTSSDRVLQMFELTFDLSIMSFAAPLAVGATVVLVSAGGSGFVGVARTLSRDRVSVALMVPSVLTFLERYLDELALPALRLSLFCGEALPERLARAWWRAAPDSRVINVYGPTEATIFLSHYELLRQAREEDSYNGVVGIGTPLPGSEFRIVDEHLVEVADDTKGELVLLGEQLTTGYWFNPEKTSAAFVTLPDGSFGYRSGDLAFRRGTQVHYAGRLDNQFKIDGYRVEAGEIEHQARQVEGVRDAALVAEEKNGRVASLQLFLLVDAEDDADIGSRCREFLKTVLPRYMQPHRVHLRRTFPLNFSGKVDRSALRQQLASGK